MRFKNTDFDNKHIAAKYIQRYFGLRCSAEMQELEIFPNLKEIQESFGIYNIIENYITEQDKTIDLKSSDIHAYVIGDGCTPRTGATLAFLTKWKVISVDPNLKTDRYFGKVNRLYVYSLKGESVSDYKSPEKPSHVVLIFPHSHIPSTNEVYKHFKNEKCWIINMPCCYQAQDKALPFNKFITFVDRAINTDKNVIRVYNNYLQ